MSEEGKRAADQQPQSFKIDEFRLQQHLQELRDNQNLGVAIIVGLITATLGAFIWATVTYLTNFQIGWMAVGIGFLVGYAVRNTGKGVDQSFGITGAVFSLFGCLLGNLLTVCVFIADEEGVAIMDVISQLDFQIAIDLMVDSFRPMDALFYGIAVYYGYRSAIFRLSDDELKKFTRPA